MQNRSKYTTSLLAVLTGLLYSVIRAIIFIGEITERIGLIPLLMAVWVYQIAKKALRVLVGKLPTAQRGIQKTGHLSLRFGFRILGYIRLAFIRIIRFIAWLLVLPLRILASLISVEFRFLLVGFILCLILISVYAAYRFVIGLPSPRDIGRYNFALSTHIYDRNGKLLYEIYKDQNRTNISLKDIQPYVYLSTIAIEDKDFYRHNGVSLISGILRAVRETYLNKSLQGGSTITQQLVKSALLTPERTYERKIKEMILALWTEQIYSKESILEMYLNQVPYGGSAYGIEEASKTYYGKSAKNLSISEAALLAGLPQAPSIYSPYINPVLAKQRRDDVLLSMRRQGYINEKQYKEAVQTDLNVVPLVTTIRAPHFVFYVKSELERQFGIQQVEEGGMRVVTSLDLSIQQEAEKILREEVEKVKSLNISNGGILVTKPSTGEILAMVGSVDYFSQPSGAFNVTTALRQPGSSIKPLTYLLALERGYTAATVIDDVPTTFTSPGGPAYQPVNYDGRFHGRVPFRYALANSFNIPAVKILNTLGVDELVSFGKKTGITSWDDSSRFGLSLTLGGGEVRMVDMAAVFGTFANQGETVAVTGLSRVYGARNEVLYNLEAKRRRTAQVESTYILSDILSDNFARRWEFGTRSALEIPGYKVAVKTGTTDMKKDNWTIGYTPDFLVAVWVGNNDNTPMNQALASGITGAAPIWNRVMTYLLTKYGASWYTKPDGVVEKQCYFAKAEYFIRGTESRDSCGAAIMGTVVSPSPTP